MDVEVTIYITFEVLIALVAVVGNSLVCYVVLQSARLRRKAMYIFVTSLALADISVALIAIPFAILTKLGLPHSSPKLCVAMLSFIMVPTQISIFNLMAIAIERYIAIRMPRIHRNKLTSRRCIAVIGCTWILSIIIGMLPLLGWNHLDAIGHVAVADFDSFLPNNTFSLLNTSESSPVTSTATFTNDYVEECQFMQVMDFDYMFFNFAACVLPPLLTSAVVYYIIFYAVTRANVTKHPGGRSAISLSTASRQRRDNGNGTSPQSNYSWSSIQQDTAKRRHSYEAANSCSPKTQRSSCESANSTRKNDGRIPVPHKPEKWRVGPTKPVHPEPVRVTVEPPSSSAHFPSYVFVNRQQVKTATGMVDTNLLNAGIDNVASQLSTDDFKPSKNGIASSHSSSSQDTNGSKASPQTSPDLKHSTSDRHRLHKRETKAAALLCLIVLCFGVCWIPIHTLNVIYRFDKGRTIQVPSVIFSIAILLSHANSMVNFILYSWRLKAFREQLNHLVLRRFRRSM